MSRVWTPSSQTTGVQETELRPYLGRLELLTGEDMDFFKERYEIDPYVATQHILRAETRYALPINDPVMNRRGIVIRQPWPGAPLPGTSSPKADTFRHLLGPVQSHYRAYQTRTGPLILVEDQLSAIKLAAYGYNSVALLGTPADIVGTYGGQDRVSEIVKRARTADEVIVALDADATDSAFMFVRKWRSAFRAIRVAILERDIKDTKARDFAEVLGV